MQTPIPFPKLKQLVEHQVAYHNQIGYKNVIKHTESLRMCLPLPEMRKKCTFTCLA